MKKDLSKQVLQKIKKEKIKPKARWYFTWKNYLIWGIGIFMILFGAFAFSLVLFAILGLNWGLRHHAPFGQFKFCLFVIPYLWIVLFSLFAFSGYLLYRKTKKGYRQHFFLITGLILGMSIILGSVVHLVGLGEHLEKRFAHRIPRYRQFMPTKERIWTKPEAGFLGGEIIQVDTKIIIVEDLSRKNWEVGYSPETKIIKEVQLANGEKIKVIGRMTGENSFEAIIIGPWGMRPGKVFKEKFRDDLPGGDRLKGNSQKEKRPLCEECQMKMEMEPF
jgi:hypothetical protein